MSVDMKQIKRSHSKAPQPERCTPPDGQCEPDGDTVLSPQAFYAQLASRPDIRELLKRLAQ
jgi:death-on-curing protein